MANMLQGNLGQAVYEGFLARGFNPAQAAALTGNFQAESSFNPQAYNPKEDAFGGMQWRLDRKAGLENYAKQTGRSAYDLETQLDWTVKEMLGPEAKSAAAFLAANDPYTANAALKPFIRYAPGSENARLEYTLAFAPEAQGNMMMQAPQSVRPASVTPGSAGAAPAMLNFPGAPHPVNLLMGESAPKDRGNPFLPASPGFSPQMSQETESRPAATSAPIAEALPQAESQAPKDAASRRAAFMEQFGAREDGAPAPAPAQPSAPGASAAAGDRRKAFMDQFGAPAAVEAGAEGMSAKDRYDAALATMRAEYYPDMPDDKWQEYSAKAFAPYGAQDLVTHGATFGLADEVGALAGAVPGLFGGASFGDRWADFKAMEEARRDYGREMAGMGGTAAEIAGGMAGIGPRAVGAAVNAAAPIASKASNMFGQMVQGVKSGAGYGAAYGAGATDGDLDQRALGAMEGVIGGGAAGALGAPIAAGVGKIAGAVAPAVRGAVESLPIVGKPASAALAPTVGRAAPVESAASIKATAQNLYDEAKGVVFDAKATPLLAHDVRAMMQKEGLVAPDGRYSDAFPRARKAMRMIEKYEGAEMTMPQFQRLTDAIQNVTKSSKPGEARIGLEMLRLADDFIEAMPQAAFAKEGPAQAQALLRANSEYARSKKTQRAEEINRVAGYHPQGFEAGLRQEVTNILRSEKQRRGYSPEEIAAMEKFVKGGPADAVMNLIAGGGVMPSALLGAVTGGHMGAAVAGGTSAAANALVNTVRRAEAQQVGNALMRSAAGMPAVPPNARPGAASSAAVNRLMQVTGAQEGQTRQPARTVNRLLATGS